MEILKNLTFSPHPGEYSGLISNDPYNIAFCAAIYSILRFSRYFHEIFIAFSIYLLPHHQYTQSFDLYCIHILETCILLYPCFVFFVLRHLPFLFIYFLDLLTPFPLFPKRFSFRLKAIYTFYKTALWVDTEKPAQQRLIKQNMVLVQLLDRDCALTKAGFINLFLAVEDREGLLQSTGTTVPCLARDTNLRNVAGAAL